MRADILFQIISWVSPTNIRLLYCLSRSFSEKLDSLFEGQALWRQITLNQTIDSDDLLDKRSDDWERIYRARTIYPDLYRDLEKRQIADLSRHLYWAANGFCYSSVSLILRDPRVVKEDIYTTFTKKFSGGPSLKLSMERDGCKQPQCLVEMISILISDRRVDTLEWFTTAIREKVSVHWRILDLLLDEENVRKRLIEEDVVELDEKITELRWEDPEEVEIADRKLEKLRKSK